MEIDEGIQFIKVNFFNILETILNLSINVDIFSLMSVCDHMTCTYLIRLSMLMHGIYKFWLLTHDSDKGFS